MLRALFIVAAVIVAAGAHAPRRGRRGHARDPRGRGMGGALHRRLAAAAGAKRLVGWRRTKRPDGALAHAIADRCVRAGACVGAAAFDRAGRGAEPLCGGGRRMRVRVGRGAWAVGWAAPGAAMPHALWPLALCVLGAAVTARAPSAIRWHYLYTCSDLGERRMASMGDAQSLARRQSWWAPFPPQARWPASLGAIALIAAAAPPGLRAQRFAFAPADWFGPPRAPWQRGALRRGDADRARGVSVAHWRPAARAAPALDIRRSGPCGAGALAWRCAAAVLRWCGLAILFATAARCSPSIRRGFRASSAWLAFGPAAIAAHGAGDAPHARL